MDLGEVTVGVRVAGVGHALSLRISRGRPRVQLARGDDFGLGVHHRTPRAHNDLLLCRPCSLWCYLEKDYKVWAMRSNENEAYRQVLLSPHTPSRLLHPAIGREKA